MAKKINQVACKVSQVTSSSKGTKLVLELEPLDARAKTPELFKFLDTPVFLSIEERAEQTHLDF